MSTSQCSRSADGGRHGHVEIPRGCRGGRRGVCVQGGRRRRFVLDATSTGGAPCEPYDSPRPLNPREEPRHDPRFRREGRLRVAGGRRRLVGPPAGAERRPHRRPEGHAHGRGRAGPARPRSRPRRWFPDHLDTRGAVLPGFPRRAQARALGAGDLRVLPGRGGDTRRRVEDRGLEGGDAGRRKGLGGRRAAPPRSARTLPPALRDRAPRLAQPHAAGGLASSGSSTSTASTRTTPRAACPTRPARTGSAAPRATSGRGRT